MTKFVLDSDGLIKLTKSGIVELVADRFECFIADEVKKESVVEGKKRLYEDAFVIEKNINEKKIKVLKAKKNTKAQRIEGTKKLGIGEQSALNLFFELDADAIISDDQAFLNVLHRENVPFIIPSDLVARLLELKTLEKKDALSALSIIKPYIKESNYMKAKKRIEVTKR